MILYRTMPRVLLPDAHRTSLHPSNYNPALILAFTGILAGVAGLVAVVADGLAFRILMALLAVLLSAVAIIGLRWAESIDERVVSIDSSARELRFVASRGTRALFPILAAIGLLPALSALIFERSGSPVGFAGNVGRWSPYVLGMLSLLWIVQQLWALRTPSGLTLAEEGVRGVRNDTRVALRWEEITHADVAGERGAKLMLQRTSGLPILIEPRWTGSDPNIVAPIISHFIDNPADRHLLCDPRAAIRRVEEVTAASA